VTIFWSVVCPHWVLIIPDLSTRAVWKIPAETSSSKEGRNLARNALEFCLQVSLFIL
jgi:hypothetical protein